ncbi:MAG: exo-alpha-sialidase, partial [Burkholderiales bacterium]
MNPILFACTRKGLFVLRKTDGIYAIAEHHFHGEPVTQFLVDPRDGAWYAALRMGHFGVKLRKSVDQGATWIELSCPALPKKPEIAPWAEDSTPWSVDLIWAFSLAGTEAGELWAGTMPAAMFRSRDGGHSWRLCDSLWWNEKRLGWFGGGNDHPGLHSIVVDPRDPRHVTVAISCGGVWSTRDDGAHWSLIGSGMHAPFMPESEQFNPNTQDAHSLSQCAAAPDTMWVQHHHGCYRSNDGAQTFTRLTAPTETDFGFPIVADPANPLRAWVVP